MSFSYRVYGDGHLADTLSYELTHRQGSLHYDPDGFGAYCLGFVAHDVTDHADPAQMREVAAWLDEAVQGNGHLLVVVLSQVPPGWMRGAADKFAASAGEKVQIFYQADTIIVRRAVARMLRPEQFIVGCADPDAPLPLPYQAYLAAHECPVRQMSYESAEVAKLAINYVLAKQVEAANVLEAVCRAVGADYASVRTAMHSDMRIGPDAYLAPGSINQHLNRDVATIRCILGGMGSHVP